jgi:hypothetical protein
VGGLTGVMLDGQEVYPILRHLAGQQPAGWHLSVQAGWSQ